MTERHPMLPLERWFEVFRDLDARRSPEPPHDGPVVQFETVSQCIEHAKSAGVVPSAWQINEHWRMVGRHLNRRDAPPTAGVFASFPWGRIELNADGSVGIITNPRETRNGFDWD